MNGRMLLACVAGLRTAGALALFAPIECLEVPVRKEWRPNLGTARSTTPVSEVSPALAVIGKRSMTV